MASWFILDTSLPGYGATLAACEAAHEANAPGCLLSVTPNLSGSEAMVKVAGVDRYWLGAALDSADASDHDRFVELLSPVGPAWASVDGGWPDSVHTGGVDGGAV